MNKLQINGIAITVIGLTIASPAMVIAQSTRLNKDALEKTRFYQAPRQVQIIDDRPIVRDFREAPQEPESIELPLGPNAKYKNPSVGGLSGGQESTIPAGGLKVGNPHQGYRSANGMGALPKSGFGPSNIPAGGLGPKGPLPGGKSTNMLMGKMLTPQNTSGASAGPRGSIGPAVGRSSGHSSGPSVASYGNGYGAGSGTNSGNSATTTQDVRGTLLRK